MTKFISSYDGHYINVDYITNISCSDTEVIVFFIDGTGGDHAYLHRNLNTKAEALIWLQDFMIANGLWKEPFTPSRCF